MTDTQPRFAKAPKVLDPLGDADTEREAGRKRNYAKVGSGRPSSLIYTYGPGAVMDLPQFTIMPSGLDDWDRIWARRDGAPPVIEAPQLRQVVAKLLNSKHIELRPFPWQAVAFTGSEDGRDLGVPSRVFPQWLRCTGCDNLGLISQFSYANVKRYRPDQARFTHEKCYGRPDRPRSKPSAQTAVPARYLLACPDGHLDEFPYDWWVHGGAACASGIDHPQLRMTDRTAGKGAAATITCTQCDKKRPMNEAQGEAGAAKLPYCRGRHPHLGTFESGGCGNPAKLMLIGASNLWFGSTQSVIVMPQSEADRTDSLAVRLRGTHGEDLAEVRGNAKLIRMILKSQVELEGVDDATLLAAVEEALAPEAPEEDQEERIRTWDPVDLLVPEWVYLQKDPLGPRQEDPASGLTLSKRDWESTWRGGSVSRVLAVESLRKVNALLGFTRIDDMDRVGDLPRRLVPLTRDRPEWTVATEDRGEGIFLQFDEARIAAWESVVEDSPLWQAHVEAHDRNFTNRFSETAERVKPSTRMRPPRYWLLHTFAHVLIRQFALTCGYSAASLSERLYAWKESEERPAAAGLAILTTASDSDGTLGGLVQLSEPERLRQIIERALYRARRCSSDPMCATRTPSGNEDFLHGAACHCCVMASETSCERANRFLDRRFLVELPGGHGPLAFFT
ncbi:DUF1998 domain-containing protein [Glycomyces tritici]|uniref:DUF1998 domain-containing protein n=1 Tax=Glycomyces tritici TaxID=2665176 RepID=A0ABT7YXU6_9ACTN|nr:DUF1998 domain-containing protein [Glycomyces tritici]MDN3243428.1 DUF1998 domain-containing protein [Glycomyces tritici]